MLSAVLPWIGRVVASLAHSFGTGWFLYPITCSSDPHSSGAVQTAHPTAHLSAAHFFIISQVETSPPACCLSVGHTSYKAVALFSGPFSVKFQAMALDLASHEFISRQIAHSFEYQP